MNILYFIKQYLLLKKHERIIWKMLLKHLPFSYQKTVRKQFAKTHRITRGTAGEFCLHFLKTLSKNDLKFPSVYGEKAQIRIPIAILNIKILSHEYQVVLWIFQGAIACLETDMSSAIILNYLRHDKFCCRCTIFNQLITNDFKNIFDDSQIIQIPAITIFSSWDIEVPPIKKELRKYFLGIIKSQIPEDFFYYTGGLSILVKHKKLELLGLGNIFLSQCNGELYYCIAIIKDKIKICVKHDDYSGEIYEIGYPPHNHPKKIDVRFSEYLINIL